MSKRMTNTEFWADPLTIKRGITLIEQGADSLARAGDTLVGGLRGEEICWLYRDSGGVETAWFTSNKPAELRDILGQDNRLMNPDLFAKCQEMVRADRVEKSKRDRVIEAKQAYINREMEKLQTEETELYFSESGAPVAKEHVHNFGNFITTCDCGVTHKEWIAMNSYKPTIQPEPGTWKKPAPKAPTCPCGQQLAKGSISWCGDCRAEMHKKITRQDLDRRIVAAKVETDPTKGWSAWATPSAES